MKDRMTFHLVGLPHTITRDDFNACAFTMKMIRFCRGMTSRGHTVYHYGNPGANVICTEHIDVVDEGFALDYVGDKSNSESHQQVYRIKNSPKTLTFHLSAVAAIRQRINPGDYVLINYGAYNEQIMNALWDLTDLPVFICEMSIGYTDSIQAPYKVFESHSIRDVTRSQWHENWKRHDWKNNPNPAFGVVHNTVVQWTDDVVEAFLDPDQFEYKDEKSDYFLFIGRYVWSKGIDLAIKVCERLGEKLIMAGQGDLEKELGYKPNPKYVQNAGHADVKTRKKLMSEAKGGFVCTHYSEPCGHVIHEYGLSGTPVIATAWGAFTTNVLHNQTGYLIHDGQEAEWAAKNIDRIESWKCRKWNMNFTIDKGMIRYENYFRRIAHHWGNKNNHMCEYPIENLNYREMIYPDNPNYDINLCPIGSKGESND